MSFWKTPAPKSTPNFTNFWATPTPKDPAPGPVWRTPEQKPATDLSDFWQAPPVSEPQNLEGFWKAPVQEQIETTSMGSYIVVDILETPETSHDLPNSFDSEGRAYGLLESTGASVADIEAFLGLVAGGWEALAPGFNPINGAAVKHILPASFAGKDIEFTWNFSTSETEDLVRYNDFAFYMVSGKDPQLLSSAKAVGSQGSSGWQTQSSGELVAADELFIAFGVLNNSDDWYNSFLAVDQNIFSPDDSFWKTPESFSGDSHNDFWF